MGQSPVELAFDSKPSTGSVYASGQVTERVQEPDRVPSVLGMLEVGVCGSGADSSSPPSSSPQLPHLQPSLLLQSHSEFTTADFYIDESMPSSYTESNSARCCQQSAPDLIHQLEETNALVTLLQVQNTRSQSLICSQAVSLLGTFSAMYDGFESRDYSLTSIEIGISHTLLVFRLTVQT